MNVINITTTVPTGAVKLNPYDVARLAQAMASWFVRRDNKFYDIDDLVTKRSRNDIELVALNRFAAEFSEVELTNDLVKAVFRRSIEAKHTDMAESIAVWNGRTVALPGDSRRRIIERGVATINLWREPEYRRLGITENGFGVASEFFEWFRTRAISRTGHRSSIRGPWAQAKAPSASWCRGCSASAIRSLKTTSIS